MWANDVRDEEQQRAVDRFLTDCVQVSEDVAQHLDPAMAKIFEGLRHSAVDGGPQDPAAAQEADSSAAADPGASSGEAALRGAHAAQLVHSDDGDFESDAAARPSGAAAKKKASKAVESPPTCN